MVLGALLYQGAVAAYQSAPLELKDVKIEGNSQKRVSNEQLVKASGVVIGSKLLNISTEKVAKNLSAIPWIADAEVERLLPSTLRIAVTERRPRMSVSTPTGRFLVDANGVVLEQGSETLVELLELPVGHVQPGDRLSIPEFRQAATILSALPRELRASVASVRARSIDQIAIQTYEGQLIFYGAAEQIEEKNFAFQSLLTSAEAGVPGSFIDVRVPSRPSVRRGSL